MHGRRNTLVKKCILFFLWTAATIIKIKAKIITETTKIATEITKTLAAIGHIDNLILTADPRDIAMSTKKKIAVHGDIQRRNTTRLKKSIKAASVTEPKDDLTTALKNTLSSILLTIKEMTVMTQRTLIRSLKSLL